MTFATLSPVGSLGSVEVDRLNRMFESAFSSEPIVSSWVPDVDIYENADQNVVIKVELPDVKRDDLKVTFENGVLTVEGDRKPDPAVKPDQYQRRERSYGHFRRSFTLPTSVDSGRAEAGYQDGVLAITLPRREEARSRQIQVS